MTSDHGEELFERSIRTSAGHGHSLYEELVRVPLVIRYAKGFPAGARVATPVSLIDLVPTLTAVTGVPWPLPLAATPEAPGGCDLSRLTAGGTCGDRAGVLSEAMPWGKASRSFRTARYMYISPTGGRAAAAELYDVAADPGERHNLVSSLPDVARSHAAWLRAYPEVESAGGNAEIDGEIRKQLKALGYVN